ncbi:hypothetical protein I552_4592 [Mycobacterium xenopi 3993]|nr:hypothetical protein I552_4592 [Mycobacterium xenopi 3993]
MTIAVSVGVMVLGGVGAVLRFLVDRPWRGGLRGRFRSEP